MPKENKMKSSTKAKVIKYIKDHGTEGLTGEWAATINGIKVGVCKSTIILSDEYTKFPPFTEVRLQDNGLLDFANRYRSQIFYEEDRSNGIVDKYYKVMEGIFAGMIAERAAK